MCVLHWRTIEEQAWERGTLFQQLPKDAALTQAVVLRSFCVMYLGVATASPPCSSHDIGSHSSIFGE